MAGDQQPLQGDARSELLKKSLGLLREQMQPWINFFALLNSAGTKPAGVHVIEDLPYGRIRIDYNDAIEQQMRKEVQSARNIIMTALAVCAALDGDQLDLTDNVYEWKRQDGR